jgi:hypothetical protein
MGYAYSVGSDEEQVQSAVCARFDVVPCPAPGHLKVGISRSVRAGAQPLHGLRIPPEGDTTGWFIWAGDWSDGPYFLEPLCTAHLPEVCVQAVPYLQLPPGWRFLVAPGYEDVWFDEALLTPKGVR